MKRRKYRRHRRPAVKRRSGKNSMMKFIGFIGIILVAVLCGYGTARFVLSPLLGYDASVLKIDFPSRITSTLDNLKTDRKDNKETQGISSDDDGKYVLQFGVFSNKEGAEQLKSELLNDGIEVKVTEADGQYKVISQLIDTKEQALERLKEIKDSSDLDVFIAKSK